MNIGKTIWKPSPKIGMSQIGYPKLRSFTRSKPAVPSLSPGSEMFKRTHGSKVRPEELAKSLVAFSASSSPSKLSPQTPAAKTERSWTKGPTKTISLDLL
jgi:hypothetical protein